MIEAAEEDDASSCPSSVTVSSMSSEGPLYDTISAAQHSSKVESTPSTTDRPPPAQGGLRVPTDSAEPTITQAGPAPQVQPDTRAWPEADTASTAAPASLPADPSSSDGPTSRGSGGPAKADLNTTVKLLQPPQRAPSNLLPPARVPGPAGGSSKYSPPPGSREARSTPAPAQSTAAQPGVNDSSVGSHAQYVGRLSGLWELPASLSAMPSDADFGGGGSPIGQDFDDARSPVNDVLANEFSLTLM